MNSWNVNLNGEDGDVNDTDESNELGQIDYKTQYCQLKRKLKFLIYENEFFQENLRQNQDKLLKITRDKSFLLDRLLKYEKPAPSTSDEDSTSEEEVVKRKIIDQKPNMSNAKRRKIVVGIKREASLNLLDDKEAMIEKLQARDSMGSEIVSSTFSTVPQELFSNEPSMDSTYGEM